MADAKLLAYVLRLADNALVLSQRMVENVAAWPELEEELANANFALDYIGQARMLYSLATELEGGERDEDDFAFMRDESEFCNLLLLEQPNGHFGDAIVRQYLYEAFYLQQLDALQACSQSGLQAIAARAVKEVQYHLRHSRRWLVRLGDGTALSHERVQRSLHECWSFTGEMLQADDLDQYVHEQFNGPDLDAIAAKWRDEVSMTIQQATLQQPEDGWMASGGKQGRHSEHLGFLLAEMQYLQRSHPGATW